MEQNFYRDDFEQMLKDSTEDFRMYPSRKVWHSIYNDLHPDRKWPSFAVCLLLLASILYIGVSNNNNISRNARNILVAANTNPILDEQEHIATGLKSSAPKNTVSITANPYQNLAANALAQTFVEGESLAKTPYIPMSSQFIEKQLNEIDWKLPELLKAPFATPFIYSKIPGNTKDVNNDKGYDLAQQNTIPVIIEQDNKPVHEAGQPSEVLASVKKLLQQNTNAKPTTKDPATISWIEDFAFHNVRNKTKWKTNTSFQYYVTPSLGYRTLQKNNDFEPTTGALLRTNDNEAVTQQAAPGFEAGAQILVGLSKKLRFKAGLQYNYTKYITYAHELQHPSQATVLMNDMNNRFVIPVSYNSYHANVLGSNFNRLNNTTNQISLPLGFDYKLAGNNRIKWYVGSSIQPSYVVSGNAVLISHDSKNFVNDASVLRNFNVNSSLETFVSFKTPSGIDINVGPQVRYQLLSTYQKEYTYTEKLYNLGVKIGITKKL